MEQKGHCNWRCPEQGQQARDDTSVVKCCIPLFIVWLNPPVVCTRFCEACTQIQFERQPNNFCVPLWR